VNGLFITIGVAAVAIAALVAIIRVQRDHVGDLRVVIAELRAEVSRLRVDDESIDRVEAQARALLADALLGECAGPMHDDDDMDLSTDDATAFREIAAEFGPPMAWPDDSP